MAKQPGGGGIAIITISTDTVWTSDQTNTDGYIVNNGATLTIDAVSGATTITIIHGYDGGVFDVQDDGHIIFRFNDSYGIRIHGTSGHPALNFQCYGIMETDYQGSTYTKNCYIGTDGSSKLYTSQIVHPANTNKLLECIWYVTDYAYVALDNSAGQNTYWKKCEFHDGTEIYPFRCGTELWVEDCYFNLSGSAMFAWGTNGKINLVGTQTGVVTDGSQSNTSNEAICRWKRAYLRVTDGSSPIANATILMTSSDGGYVWAGVTDSNGKLDTASSRFSLDYLLACYSTYNHVEGEVAVSSSVIPSILTIYKVGYEVYTTTHDMSSDWGSAGSYVDIVLRATSPRVTAATATLAEED